MKNLVCGLWDEKGFILIAICVHKEPGKNRNRSMKNKELANQFYKEKDAESLGFQRVNKLGSDKISITIQMVKDAIKMGFELDYVS